MDSLPGGRRRPWWVAAAAVLCTAVVAGGCTTPATRPPSAGSPSAGSAAAACGGGSTARSAPSLRPKSSPGRVLVEDPAAQLQDVHFADRCSSAAVWRLCAFAGRGACRSAVVMTTDGWVTHTVLPTVYDADADGLGADLVMRSLPGGGLFLEAPARTLTLVTAAGVAHRLRWSPTPLPVTAGRFLLGTIGYATEDNAVLDPATRTVHPLTLTPGYPLRLDGSVDRGVVWALGIDARRHCRILTGPGGGSSWHPLSVVPCVFGDLIGVSLAVLPAVYLVLSAPSSLGPDPGTSPSPVATAAAPATLIVASTSAGTLITSRRLVQGPTTSGQHLVRVGGQVGLVTVGLDEHASTVAPVDPGTGAVGSAAVLPAVDLMEDPVADVAWTQDGNHVSVYADSVVAGVPVTVR